MSKRKGYPDFARRLELWFKRTGLDMKAFADFFGVADTTARDWIIKNASPGLGTVRTGVENYGPPDPLGFLWWIAGADAPDPTWLSGEPGSDLPRPPTPPAMPFDVRKLLPVAQAMNETGATIKTALAKSDATPQPVREALEEASVCMRVAKRKLAEADQSGLVSASLTDLLKSHHTRFTRVVA